MLLHLALGSAPDEAPTARRLLLLLCDLGFGPVEDLEELCNSRSHPTVHVRFRALDVVV